MEQVASFAAFDIARKKTVAVDYSDDNATSKPKFSPHAASNIGHLQSKSHQKKNNCHIQAMTAVIQANNFSVLRI